MTDKGLWLPYGDGRRRGVRRRQATTSSTAPFTWPVMVARRSAIEANIATMAAYCARHGVELAPHGKTTMAPSLFAAQLAAGAWGITVATANQALAARRFGVPRVLLANEVLDPAVLRWAAAEVAAGWEFLCYVDSLAGVDGAARGGRCHGGLAHGASVAGAGRGGLPRWTDRLPDVADRGGGRPGRGRRAGRGGGRGGRVRGHAARPGRPPPACSTLMLAAADAVEPYCAAPADPHRRRQRCFDRWSAILVPAGPGPRLAGRAAQRGVRHPRRRHLRAAPRRSYGIRRRGR